MDDYRRYNEKFVDLLHSTGPLRKYDYILSSFNTLHFFKIVNGKLRKNIGHEVR